MWDADRLRLATDAAGVALWSWNVDTGDVSLDARAHELWGIPAIAPVTFDTLSARIHPTDRGRVKKAFEAARKQLGIYEVDFRISHGEGVRWICARGMGDGFGNPEQAMLSVFLDVTDRKLAEEARDMLVGEMSHRVKNLFAIASALTAIAARSAATTAEMARDLTHRLTALGRAHDLVRPLPGEAGETGALLGDLLAILLAPYDQPDATGHHIRVSVPQIPVGERTATTLALVVHELATNSIKYGALSAASGVLDVSCVMHDDEVVVLWTEKGGPAVSAPPRKEGFGTKLIMRSVSGQLGGAITFDWAREGVAVTIRMSKSRIAH